MFDLPLIIILDGWCMGRGLFLLMKTMHKNKLFIILYLLPMNENILIIFFYGPDESE